MRLVVADTGPLNYLVLTGDIELLPRLFGRIIVPTAVCEELAHPEAPLAVRDWINRRPDWLVTHANPDRGDLDAVLAALDDGERAAIALAVTVKADLFLIDDRDGAAVARREGFPVTGTLGVSTSPRAVE
jgi:predicted nucleic acid-binding protein